MVNSIKQEAKAIGIITIILGSMCLILTGIWFFSINDFSWQINHLIHYGDTDVIRLINNLIILSAGIALIVLGIFSLLLKSIKNTKKGIIVFTIIVFSYNLVLIQNKIYIYCTLTGINAFFIFLTLVNIICIVLSVLVLFRVLKYNHLTSAYQNSFSGGFSYVDMGSSQKPQTFAYMENHTDDLWNKGFTYAQPTAPSVKRICAGCGSENDENAKFCEFCGKHFLS